MLRGYQRPIRPQIVSEPDVLVRSEDIYSGDSGSPGYQLNGATPPGSRPQVLMTHDGMDQKGSDYGSWSDMKGFRWRIRHDGV